jgi:hypothetical protein
MNIIDKDKPCTVCHTRKDINLFYKNKRSKDGREYMCMECRKGKNKSHYVSKPERSPWRKERSFV